MPTPDPMDKFRNAVLLPALSALADSEDRDAQVDALLLQFDAALKSERERMVAREVAMEASKQAWGHGRLRFAGGGFVEHPVDPRRIFNHGTDQSNAKEYLEASECAHACLVRAECAHTCANAEAEQQSSEKVEGE